MASTGPPYRADEFLYHHYLARNEAGERRALIAIEHRPSGRSSATVDVTGLGGGDSSRLVQDTLEALIRELHADGVAPEPPQPPPVARKKLGKPRRRVDRRGNDEGEER